LVAGVVVVEFDAVLVGVAEVEGFRDAVSEAPSRGMRAAMRRLRASANAARVG